MSQPRFTVAVVGGGIAGLIFVIALGKYADIEIHVYEAASKFGELGVGLAFTPSSWDVFEKLGVDGELLKYMSTKPSSKEEERPLAIRRKSDQDEGFAYYTTTRSRGTITIHRIDCQTALLQQLPPSCQVSLSKRLVSYNEQGSGIELTFQDGSMAKCDLLIGADGYKSTVRRCLLHERAKAAKSEEEAKAILSAVEPFFTGGIAYRAVVSSDKVRALHPGHSVFTTGNVPILYCGQNAFVFAFPIQQGKLVNVAATHLRHELEDTKYDGPLASPASPSELTAVYGQFESEVQSLMKCVENCTKWAIHSVKPMETFVYKNVALIGDAAHAMTPFLGVGAGQAVEDAYILATVLGHQNTTRSTLGHALEVYDTVRRPVALAAQENSRKHGQYNAHYFQDVNFAGRTDQKELWEDLQRLGQDSQLLITATNSGIVDPYVEEALRMME